MQAILFAKVNTIQNVDKKGFIKRDLAAERNLTSHMKSRGVINFNLDDFISDDEGDVHKQQDSSNRDNNNQNNNLQNKGKLTKLFKLKDFVTKNPYLKEIIKETKHFISKKSTSLIEYFNFATMNPFNQNNNNNNNNNNNDQNVESQKENVCLKGNQVQQQNASLNSSICLQKQNDMNKKEAVGEQKGRSQNSFANVDESNGYARSDSSIVSNANRFSQNDSMSISSRIQQFIKDQKTEIREKEEKRIHSLNLSFRSVSNNLNRHSNPSVQSETLQNKRQNKLMENIFLQNSKKVKTSKEEVSQLSLNKSQSIRFLNINKELENGEVECESYDHQIGKLNNQKKANSSIATFKQSQSNNIEAQMNQNSELPLQRLNTIDERYEDQEQDQMQIKQNRLELQKTIPTFKKVSQTNKFRIQFKRILEMRNEARKLNIEYSQYTEQLYNQKLNSKSNNKGNDKKTDKYQSKITSQKLKELSKVSNSNYSQFLCDPDVILSRGSSYIYGLRKVDSQMIQSQSQNSHMEQKDNTNEQDSTLIVNKNRENNGKQKQKRTQKLNQNDAILEKYDSQSISEQSCSSSPSSSNSLSPSSSKQPKNSRLHQPFDDECSMSSIQRHTDDDDSAIMMNIFPTTTTPTNNNTNDNSNNNNFSTSSYVASVPSAQYSLFKKPLEKKQGEEYTNVIQQSKTPSKTVSSDQLTNPTDNEIPPQTQNTVESASDKQPTLITIIAQETQKFIDGEEKQSQKPLAFEQTGSNILGINKEESKNINGSSSLFFQETPKPASTNSLFANPITTSEISKPNAASTSLFSNLSTVPGTETKPKNTQLFSNLNSSATTEAKPAATSLFANSTTNTVIKPNTLFPSATSESIKPNTLFPAQKPEEETKPNSALFPAQKQEEAKPNSLFSSSLASGISNQEAKQINLKQSEEKPLGLFGQPIVGTENKEVGLFANISNKNESQNILNAKPLENKNSLFGQSQADNQTPQNGMIQFSNKEDQMEMGNENGNNMNKSMPSSLFGGNGTLINDKLQSTNNINSNNSQLQSPPIHPANSNANSNIINPFGVAINSSPFSQNPNPFSGSQQQKQNFSLSDLIKNNSMNFNFQQPATSAPITTQVETNTFQQNNQSALFSNPQNSLFQQNPQNNNNLFQPAQNSLFGGNISQFQQNPTQQMGGNQAFGINQNMNNNNNNTAFSSFNQAPQQQQQFNQMSMGMEMQNNNLMQGNSNISNPLNNNSFFQQSSNMATNNFNSYGQPPASMNYFGDSTNNLNSSNNNFSMQNQAGNSFMNQSNIAAQNSYFNNASTPLNQNASSMFGNPGLGMQQSSLFSQNTSMTTQQSNVANRKKGNAKARIS